MDQLLEEEKKQDIVKYVVGDLLWAKIGNHPFWPCMVSYDPYEGSYYKKKKIARRQEAVSYHVQYFGKQVQHGWTSPSLIIPFQGEEAFESEREALKTAAKSKAAIRKVASKYNVSSGIRDIWLIAVKEAETAMALEVQERYESYVFKYESNFKKSATKSDSTKKPVSKEKSNKPKKAKEPYGADRRVCKVCGEENIDLLCAGTCFQYFHKDCLGLVRAPENFKCVPCEKGLFACFICKKTDRNDFTFNCKKCKFHYHQDCADRFPTGDVDKRVCPSHVCLTCNNGNLKLRGPLLSCIRCPTSFHATLKCLPAGSVKLSTSTMICPDHFMGKDKVSPQITSNVTYCYVCSEGGDLICCESCPNSFHTMCLDNPNEVPTGDFICDDCMKRQFLYVGMIVWAKTGNFRWWPAQIADWDDLPINVRNMDHYDGEFPVQYYGTDEYFWTHRGRVIPYADPHKEFFRSGGHKQCRLDDQFKISLEEAAEAYDQYVHMCEMQTVNGKREAYKHIKVNRAVPPAHIANLGGKMVLPCSCNPSNSYPCGQSSGCLNRSMLMECHPSVCPAGERCENQKFQRRQYARVEVFRTKDRGWGLKSNQTIHRGDFVIEYVGEVITHEEYRRRVAKMQEKNDQNYYFLYLDARRMIDAGPQGNLSRFINHSCSANCEMVKWSVNGDSRIGIFAKQNIYTGDELTFNYQSDTVQFKQKCFCESPSCQGFIGRNGEKHRKKMKTKK